MIHGCCVDRDYYKKDGRGSKGCDEETCMQLPEGKTCADCVHTERCCEVLGCSSPDRDYCDFFPRRFHQRQAATG
jgi:hypothetical protein